MEFNKCFMCCNLLNKNSCQINEEIKELYLELTSITLLEIEKKFRVCSECHTKLRACVTFKKSTITSREQFYKETFIIEQDVKVEVFPEEYRIIDTSAAPASSKLGPVPSTRKKLCSTCHHQMSKQEAPLKGVMYCCCPSCGLTVSNELAKESVCQFCKGFKTQKLSQLRMHLFMKHKFFHISKCDRCSSCFFSEGALKKHQEVCHLIASKKKVEASAIESVKNPILVRVSTTKRKIIPTFVKVQTKATDSSEKLNSLESSSDDVPFAVDEISAISDEISPLPQSSIRKCELCQVPSDFELSMDLKSQILTPCLSCGKNISRRLKAKCTICGVAINMKSLVIHYKIRHKDQEFVRCSEGCDQVFLSESAKIQHNSYHTLRCTCDETFKNIRSYKMHQRDCYSQRSSEVVQVNVPEENDEPPSKILRMGSGSTDKISFHKKDPSSLVRRAESAENLPENDPLQITEIKIEKIQNKPIELLTVNEEPTEDPLLTTNKVPSESFESGNQAIEPIESVAAVKTVKNLSKSVTAKKSKNVSNNSRNLEKNFEPSANENKTMSEPCSVCDSRENVERESEASRGRKTTCPKCKGSVEYSENLRMKMEKFKCSICQFKTFDNVEIRKHIEVQHSRSKIVFQCNLCHQTLESEEVLKEHSAKSHSFFCSICTSKKFLRKEALDEHMKKHQKKDITWESEESLFDLIEIN